jgi:RecA-family ATPase
MAEHPAPARLTDLLTRPAIECPAWISPVILPKRGLMLFGGHSKIGKSFQALEMARALATGSNLFGYGSFKAEECRVLYVEREVGEYGLQSRCREIFKGEDFGRIADNLWYVSQDSDLNVDTHAGIGRLGEYVSDLSINVLILDPISSMFSVDENDATAMSKVFNNLEHLRKVFVGQDLSVVLAHHFGKPPNGKGSETYDHLSHHNFRGSSKFFSVPDTVCTSWRAEELNLDWQAWRLKCRWVCRQGESPPEQYLTVNQNRDLRVRWERNATERKVADTSRTVRFSPTSG